ncbi:twin-arginine translocation signal domain-containing protein [Methylobacterium oryzae CBMB20]
MSAETIKALSRRHFLKAGAAAGVAVKVSFPAPPARAQLAETGLPPPAPRGPRRAGPATASTPSPRSRRAKTFSRDYRARDLAGWPDGQAHAFLVAATRADRRFTGIDLSRLPAALRPDRIVRHEDLVADGVSVPHADFFGDWFLVPQGEDAAPARAAGGDPDLRRLPALRRGQARPALRRRRRAVRRRDRSQAAGPLRRLALGADRGRRAGRARPVLAVRAVPDLRRLLRRRARLAEGRRRRPLRPGHGGGRRHRRRDRRRRRGRPGDAADLPVASRRTPRPWRPTTATSGTIRTPARCA